MNTNPRCLRCHGQTWGASHWCTVHGDQLDVGPLYVGEPLPRDRYAVAGEVPCPNCGAAYSKYGLRSHMRWCVVQARLEMTV